MFHSRKGKPGGSFLIFNDGSALSDDPFTIQATHNLIYLLRRRYVRVWVTDLDHTNNSPPVTIGEIGPKARRRFFSYIEKTPTCWLWKRGHSKGYAQFWFRGRSLLAHRVAYELFVGEIPRGLTIDHLCRNTGCVNPQHLEPATWPENGRRAIAYQYGGRVYV